MLWQVGTNDALAYVPLDEFDRDRQRPDRLAEGPQGRRGAGRPAIRQARCCATTHYIEIREILRKLAAKENVIIIRRYEAMQIIDQASAQPAPAPVAEEFERTEAGYNCLAQYVARAITLGVFGKNMPKRPSHASLTLEPND